MENTEPWYSVKCIFRHDKLVQNLNLSEEKGKTMYEERIVLFRANSFEEAIALGEAEARQYAERDSTLYYTGFIDAYHLFEREFASGSEVYSLMRQSNRATEEFIDHYYNDGTERTQHVEEQEKE